MIVTYSSGKEGIIDYLESGQHKDRDYDREELDHREILIGSPVECKQILSLQPKIKSEGEKYKHFTLSFKEDILPDYIYKSIAKEFNEFILAEYREDEAYFYAEAHLPKIKNYMSKTGHVITRKPHIHIVIPTINLLSGTKTLSFGYSRFGMKEYVLSFQEHVNSKYGLESPLEIYNRNLFVDNSLRMHEKGAAYLENGNRNVRVEILNLIISNNIKTQAELRDFLHEKYAGELESIETDFKGEYLFMKYKEGRGIALKDFAFSQDFLSLPTNDKIRLGEEFYSRKATTYNKITTQGVPRALDYRFQSNLDQWYSFGKYEVKYGRMLGRNYDKYAQSEYKDKLNTLLTLRTNFYEKIHNDPQYNYDKDKIFQARNLLSDIGIDTTLNKPLIQESELKLINNLSLDKFLNLLELRYGINISLYKDKASENRIYSYKTNKYMEFDEFLAKELYLSPHDIINCYNSIDRTLNILPSSDVNISPLNMALSTYEFNQDTLQFIPKFQKEAEKETHELIAKFREYIAYSDRNKTKESTITSRYAENESNNFITESTDLINKQYMKNLEQIEEILANRSKLLASYKKKLLAWKKDALDEVKKHGKKIYKTVIRDSINYSTGAGINKLAIDNRFKYFILENMERYPSISSDVKKIIKNIMILDSDLAYKVSSSDTLKSSLNLQKDFRPRKPLNNLSNFQPREFNPN